MNIQRMRNQLYRLGGPLPLPRYLLTGPTSAEALREYEQPLVDFVHERMAAYAQTGEAMVRLLEEAVGGGTEVDWITVDEPTSVTPAWDGL